MRKVKLLLLVSTLIFLSGCTDPDASTSSGLRKLKEDSVVEEYTLVQLETETAQETHGKASFIAFVGGGQIDSKETPYYLFYIKSMDGGIKMKREDIDNVVIYETTGVPSAEYLDLLRTSCPPIRDKSSNNSGNCQHWILYVPKGSIVNRISADLPSKQ